MRQLHIKSKTYYFYNDLINIKNFNNNKLKLDKKGVLGNDVYYIGYITKTPHWHVLSVNPLIQIKQVHQRNVIFAIIGIF